MRRLCPIVALLFLFGRVAAQDSLGFQRYQIIGIDFQKKTLVPAYLPFDVPYRLYVSAPDSIGIDSVVIQCLHVKGRFNKPVQTRWQPMKREGATPAEKATMVFRKDIYTKDTLYLNVNVPLRPSQSYTYDFTVFRKVLDKESQDLDSLFKHLMDSVLWIYFPLFTGEWDSSLVELLAKRMAANVDSYFAKKRIDTAKGTLEALRDGLPAYLNTNYGNIFLQRNYYYNKENRQIQDLRNIYGTGITSRMHLDSVRLLYRLDTLGRNKMRRLQYGMDSLTWVFIHDILRDPDSLGLFLGGIRSHADPEFSQNRRYSADQVKGYRTVIDSLYTSCGVVVNLIKQIRRNPDLAGFFKEKDSVLLRTGSEYFADVFFTWVQDLKIGIDQYYKWSVAFDSIMAKPPPINYQTEFPISLKDGSVGLTSADFITRGAWFLIADIGFAYINTYPTGQIRPYVGVNFNVFPINRQANYSLFKHPYYSVMGNLVRSLSFTVGATVFSTFGAKDKYTETIGTTGSVLTGIALRLSDGIRFSSGAIWVNQKSANPLSDSKTLTPLWYSSLSIDLTLKKWLGGLAKFFN